MTHAELLRRYVELHNGGVHSGDFAPLLALFHRQAVLEFRGFGIGPFRGSAQIARAFEETPPDEELVIVDAVEVSSVASVRYAWRGRPEIAGSLELVSEGDRILRLTVTRAG